jgi:prevent-host-death family protein
MTCIGLARVLLPKFLLAAAALSAVGASWRMDYTWSSPMKYVTIHEAKAHLSRLVERVQAGEEIVIAKAGRPAARLVPIEGARRPVKIGGLKARAPVPDDFNTMFEKEIGALFAGTPTAAPRRNGK